MTIGQSIVEWLYTFGNIEVDAVIETDQLDASAGSYGIFKEPTRTVLTFVDGSQDVTERYYFMARQASKQNISRVNNNAWLELLEQWVRMQNLTGNLPALDGNRNCYSVGIAVSYYMADAESDTASYQLSVEIKFTEEKNGRS